MRPSLLTSWNSGCQAVEGSASPPVNGRVALTPRLSADVAVRWLAGPAGQGLEAVRALARQVHVRVSVAGDVIAGDSHALDLDLGPPVGGGVEARSLAGRHPPELLLADGVVVVVAVVADPQVPPPGAVPVAEQHRQRAVARRQDDRRPICQSRGDRPDQQVVATAVGRLATRVEAEVLADGQGRQSRRRLPGRAEAGRQGVTAVERPGLVGPLEPAAAEPPEQDALARAEHRQIGMTVAIDVERVGADHIGQVRGRVRGTPEAQRAAHRALVQEEGCRLAPSREVQLRPAVVVAVERSNASAEVEREITVVGVVESGCGRFLHEVRRTDPGCPVAESGDRQTDADGCDEPHDDQTNRERSRPPDRPLDMTQLMYDRSTNV